MNKNAFFVGLVFCVFFTFQHAKTQTTVYIDPSFSGATKNGTLSNPYSSMPVITENTTYLFKAGTVYNINAPISVTAANISFGAYGTGAKPVVNNTNVSNRTIVFGGNGPYLIKGVSFFVASRGVSSSDAGTGNVCFFNNKAMTLHIDDCYIKGGNPAINGYKTGTVKISNSHITKATYDSYYSEFVDYVSFINTTIDSSYIDVSNSNLVGSVDLIHVLHTLKLKVEDCVLDHSTTPGKYCIIYHKNFSLPEYNFDSLFVTNTRFIGSQDNQALVKPSIHYASFKDCLFFDAIRTMQDVTDNLVVDNCLFKSTVPLANQLFGIQNNVTATIKNATFIGIKSPYVNAQPTSNCIFWNCTGNGTYTNSLADPLVDATYTAKAPSLIGVGYVAKKSPIAIQEVSKKSIRVFPNPATDQLHFSLTEPARAKIIDLQGRVVWSEKLWPGDKEISLTFQQGQYILQLMGDSGWYVAELLIIK